jgi:hypothetical protein
MLEPSDPWPNPPGCQVVPERVAFGRYLLGWDRRRLGLGRLTVGDCERVRKQLRDEVLRQRRRAQPGGCLLVGVTPVALGERRDWFRRATRGQRLEHVRRRLDGPGWLGYRFRDTDGH